jgi:hypothetical protein
LSREELKSAVRLGNPRESGAGMATVRRVVITNTALDESGRLGGSAGFLGSLSGRRGPLNKVAYSLPSVLERVRGARLNY